MTAHNIARAEQIKRLAAFGAAMVAEADAMDWEQPADPAPARALEPDREQLATFIAAMFKHASAGSYVSLRAFDGETGKPTSITAVKIVAGNLHETLVEAAVDEARKAARHAAKPVFAPPIATFSGRKRATVEDTVDGLDIALELDEHPQQSLAYMVSLLGEPTFVIASGGEWTNPETSALEPKLHAHWLLNKAANGEQLDILREARGYAIDLVGGDKTHKPFVHPIRWPGSWHRKAEPRLCRIVTHNPDREIDLTEAHEILRRAVAGNKADRLREAGESMQPQPLDIDAAFEALDWRGTGKGGNGYETVLRVIASMLSRGEQINDIVARLEKEFVSRYPETADWDWDARFKDEFINWFVKHPELLDEQNDPPEWLTKDRRIKNLKREAKAEARSETLFDPWAQFIVPEFPLDILSPVTQKYVTGQAEVIGCDVSSMTMATLTAYSGAIDHGTCLKMMRHGVWYVSPNLWTLLFGDPSQKKTPIINAVTWPAEQYQQQAWGRYKDECRYAEDPKKIAEPIRYVAYDSTIEKLADILAHSNRGLLVKRDELAGWIGQMEKYGGSNRGANANRAFWLQAYDGGAHIVDRIQRGVTVVEKLSTSLLGGMQPQKLIELHGLTSDGLLQRFLPVMMGASKFALDIGYSISDYTSLVQQLLELKPRSFTLSNAALEAMTDLRRHLHDLEQVSGGLAEGFQSFVGKLAGVAGKFALILHVVADPAKCHDEIGVKTVEDVRGLMTGFIIPHAMEFYRTAESSGSHGDRLKKLASWILTNGQPRFVVSDLTSNVIDFRGLTPFEVNERVSPLEAVGWITPNIRGGIARAWTVNPAVFTRFADRTKIEEARKVNLAKAMGSPRKEKM